MTARRRELRQRNTVAERQLWILLRRFREVGLSFRRQHSIGWYIADFYCPKAKLVIELDGPVHENDESIEYDRIRDEFMKSSGLTVIRFKNHEITENPTNALLKIKEILNKQTSLTTNFPLPLDGRGIKGEGV